MEKHGHVAASEGNKPAPVENGWGLIRLAAADQAGLERLASDLAARAAAGAALPFGIVVGGGARRAAFAVQGREGLALELGRVPLNAVEAPETAPRLAFLLPGLGESLAGMGTELFAAAPELRRVLAEAEALLGPEVGPAVTRLLTATPSLSPAARLRAMLRPTAPDPDSAPITLTHPALFVLEYALARVAFGWGCRPDVLIGYSLGEYVAACLAGIFSFADALTLVSRRAGLIESLPGGVMLAVPAAAGELDGLLPDGVHIVAENGPALTIVGGTAAAAAEFTRLAAASALPVHRVAASHAFHTPMMEPVRARVEELVARCERNPPSLAVISTVTGEPAADEMLDPAYWGRQLCETVRFGAALSNAARESPTLFLEVGPGQALSSQVELLPRAARGSAAAIPLLTSGWDEGGTGPRLLQAMAQAWTAGAPVGTLPRLAGSSAGERKAAGTPLPASEGETLDRVRQAWSQVLGRPSIGADDNFFDLGGNSLLALRICREMRRVCDAELSIRDVFEAATPAALALRVAGRPEPAGERGAVQRPKLWTTLPNGLRIRHQSPAETEHFYANIFVDRAYLQQGLKIPENATVLDVGANIGMFSLFVATERPDARIFAFEPAPPLFDILSGNIRLGAPNARAFDVGLGAGPASARLTFYPQTSGMSSFSPDLAEETAVLRAILQSHVRQGRDDIAALLENESGIMDARFVAEEFVCKIEPLSRMLRDLAIGRVDLLKIDVQKLELEVLKGIGEEQWPMIDQIVVEVHDVEQRVEKIVRMLGGKGYRCSVVQDELYAGSSIFNVYASR